MSDAVRTSAMSGCRGGCHDVHMGSQVGTVARPLWSCRRCPYQTGVRPTYRRRRLWSDPVTTVHGVRL